MSAPTVSTISGPPATVCTFFNMAAAGTVLFPQTRTSRTRSPAMNRPLSCTVPVFVPSRSLAVSTSTNTGSFTTFFCAVFCGFRTTQSKDLGSEYVVFSAQPVAPHKITGKKAVRKNGIKIFPAFFPVIFKIPLSCAFYFWKKSCKSNSLFTALFC